MLPSDPTSIGNSMFNFFDTFQKPWKGQYNQAFTKYGLYCLKPQNQLANSGTQCFVWMANRGALQNPSKGVCLSRINQIRPNSNRLGGCKCCNFSHQFGLIVSAEPNSIFGWGQSATGTSVSRVIGALYQKQSSFFWTLQYLTLSENP